MYMKNIKKWSFIGTIFIIVFGTLLHYVYQWSGFNPLVGIFGAVNESVWEHLKLIFWPSFIYALIEYKFIGKDYNNYIAGKAVSFYTGMFLIAALFYTYTGILGSNFLFADVLIFILSVIISRYVGYKIITNKHNVSKQVNVISKFAIILLVLAFVLFTFNPPKIPLFREK